MIFVSFLFVGFLIEMYLACSHADWYFLRISSDEGRHARAVDDDVLQHGLVQAVLDRISERQKFYRVNSHDRRQNILTKELSLALR